jgi:catalase-peroxidase
MRRLVFFSWLISAVFILEGCTNNPKPEMVETDGYSGATMKSNSNMKATSNSDWWPNQLNLNLLRQNSQLSNPMGATFNYAQEFNSIA